MIHLEMELTGAAALAAANARFRARYGRTVVNALRRGIRRTIKTTKADMRTRSGLGQSVWGKKASGLNQLVTLIRARQGASGQEVETGIKFKGLARLVEEGGVIKPHFIRNGFGRDGNRIPHPGMVVRAHGFGGSNLRSDERAIFAEVDVALQQLVAAVYGQ